MKRLSKDDEKSVVSLLGDAAALCGEEDWDGEGRVNVTIEQNTMIAIAKCLQAIAIMMRSDRE